MNHTSLKQTLQSFVKEPFKINRASMQLKKPNQPTQKATVNIQSYYSKQIVSDLTPRSHKVLHRTKSQIPELSEAKEVIVVVLGQQMARTFQMPCYPLRG